MRILLLGEYSRLHNTLKEGLLALGHEVIIAASGDGFKQYPVDYSIEAKWSHTKLVNIFRQIIFSITKFDIGKIETGIRFYLLLPKLKGFDIVQLINESPITTLKSWELLLLKKIIQNNNKLFLLSTGVDYLNVNYWFNHKEEKSILKPLFENPSLQKEYQYILEYQTKQHKKIHDFIYQNCQGIIATDVDYLVPLKGNPKFLGLIPNPINYAKLNYQELTIENKIVIFLGINQWSYYQKGIRYFEKALEIIQEKYKDNVEIIVVKNIPYSDYINLYNKAHILLDQMHGHDQGYNALEAMAKGKVVFTNASSEFEKYYDLDKKIAIHAEPNVYYLVAQLSFLIENPKELIAMSKRARDFIEGEHDYLKIAENYLKTWGI
ncbi:glycosyltransferase [Flavobacterium sp.]|jgi:glycosyltransferase involved in cell wall biosynthesis|uniref:glycosyltransferase n=1 Tax=Flavobacterium sp. TaxID=239 RepID=UPI0037C14135